MADAPDMAHDRIDGAELDALCEAYTAITGDRVRTAAKKRLVAAAYRVHGPDTLSFITEVFRSTGTATNLLGLVRTAVPRSAPASRVPHPSAAEPFAEVPPSSPVTATGVQVDPATWDGCRCPLERLLPDLIYCADHLPAFGSVGSARHDRRASNPRAARFLTDIDGSGSPEPGAR